MIDPEDYDRFLITDSPEEAVRSVSEVAMRSSG